MALSDTTAFLLGFTTIFGALAFYLWRLDRTAARLAARMDNLDRDRPRE